MPKLLVEWIVDRRHAFREVESSGLRKIFQYLDPRSIKALTMKKTIKEDCMRYFKIAKASVIQALSHTKSRIHLEFDLWTSPNYKAMITITTHWTNDEYKVQLTLIAIQELNSDHDGENISEIIHLVAKEFEFVDRIGYFIGDNVIN